MCFIMNAFIRGRCRNRNAQYAESSCLRKEMEMGGNNKRIEDKIAMLKIEITGIQLIIVIYIKN